MRGELITNQSPATSQLIRIPRVCRDGLPLADAGLLSARLITSFEEPTWEESLGSPAAQAAHAAQCLFSYRIHPTSFNPALVKVLPAACYTRAHA